MRVISTGRTSPGPAASGRHLQRYFGDGTWGGFPGHTPDAIGSGTGTVGNAFQLREPQKTVLSYAFRPRIKPLTSVTNRTAGTTLRRALEYWTSDDLRRVPAATASAIRG